MGDGPVLPTRLLAMLGGIHSAHAHGIAGNRSFPARYRLMIRQQPTKRLCQILQASNGPATPAILSIIGLIGRFFVFLLRPSELALTVRGFTGTGAMLCARDPM